MSDVHGNLTALEAVVADGEARGVERWWVLGDLVAIGPDPIGVLEVAVALPGVEVIAGNTERYVLTRDRPPPSREDVLVDPDLFSLFSAVEGSFAWTRGALAAGGWLGWLSDLPAEVRTVLPDGTRVLGVHASPGRDDGEGITPHRDESALRVALADAEADVVVAGHTHQPTDRLVDRVRALNLGSVSNPVTDDLRASYAILAADGEGHRVEHRRVAYDREAFLDGLARSGHPEADFIASFQRGEQVRHRSVRPGAPTVSG